MRHRRRPVWFFNWLIVLVAVPPASGDADVTDRVSVSSSGAGANGESFGGSISSDGRFVEFTSYADNLVPVDTNLASDVFVRDRQTETTERVSVSSSGMEADADSNGGVISADGRFVLFDSHADNLVAGDTNGYRDVFVRDRQTATTERVSVSSSGLEAADDSFGVDISADGRFVVFYSGATTLVPGDMNHSSDVFVRDRLAGTTERVSVSSGEVEANSSSSGLAISADGRFVEFSSSATNLVSGDTNGVPDVFLRDRETGTTERVSVSSSGLQGNDQSRAAALSADGRFVLFDSRATNLVPGDTNQLDDVFVRDRQAGTTERVNVSSNGGQANSESAGAALSADGRFVMFSSHASNLVPGDTSTGNDVFVRDRQSGTIDRVSLSPGGMEANGESWGGSMSAGGRFVAFTSKADNLAPGDMNTLGDDVFVRVRSAISETTTTTIATVSTTTTTIGLVSTTTTPPTTTLPCTSARCIIDATITGGACTGQNVPASVTGRFDRGVSLIEQAAASPPKKAPKKLRKARQALRQAKANAKRAARGRKPKISSDCSTALGHAADRVTTTL